MKKAILLTGNNLELDCIILTSKPLISGGEEVLAYCQNRLVKGYVSKDDDSLVAEISIIVNYVIIPELDNELILCCTE